MQELFDVDEILDALGGNKAVADAVGVGQRAVSMWRIRGLPPNSYKAISELLKAKELYASPALWRMRELVK